MKAIVRVFIIACALLFAWPAIAAPGDLESGFNPGADNRVFTSAVQPDGKIIFGGIFTGVGGGTRNRTARVLADGTLDAAFDPNVSGPSSNNQAIAVQADGRIVLGGVFTGVGGVTRNRIARVNADGTLDAAFDPNASSTVSATAPQPDGKIVIAGGFTTVGGVTRNRLARVNADGTLDTGFDPNAGGTVNSAVVQADGKVLVAGAFTTVGGVTRNRIARVNADGTLDTAFNPNANGTVSATATQADGKIVIGGGFTTIGGVTRNGIARLNTDGTLDTAFNPDVTGSVESIAAQADGKIVIAGPFSAVSGVARSSLARLNADGTLDAAIAPATDFFIFSTALQADGKILIVGRFNLVNGVTRNRIARLENDAATQSLTVPSSGRIEWLRGGAAPETQHVTFELSTDGGSVWTPLGAGVRIAGGWEKIGLSLPASGHIRARARMVGGYYNGSSGLVETITAFNVSFPEIVVEQPMGTNLADGGGRDFGSVMVTASTSLQFTIRNTGTGDLAGLTITKDGANAAEFNVTANPTAPVVPGGSTTFTVQFAPTIAGAKTAALHIANNDGDENPFDITLTGMGTGTAPEIAVEQPVGTNIVDGGGKDFGSVPVGGSASLLFTIKNTGTADLTGLTITKDGADAALFTVTANPTALVNAGGFTTFTVQFTPGGSGAKTAALHLASNDADENPFDLTLTATGTAGGLDAAFDPNINNDVFGLAVQPDAKNLVTGHFTTVGGVARTFAARLNADTTLDGGFNPSVGGLPDNLVFATAVQPDGKIILGGAFTLVNGVARGRIARLNADTTLDAGFNASLGGIDPQIRTIAVQPDGKIVIAGYFNAVNGVARTSIARLHADGTLDTAFNPVAAGAISIFWIYSAALQPDGKIVIGGEFTSVGGVARFYAARLNGDGTLDPDFNPRAGDWVECVLVQPDGKIVLGGNFPTMGLVIRGRIARVNADGTLDTRFDPNANGTVYSMVAQTDGKIIMGGAFTTVGGVAHDGIARLNTDGTLDTLFTATANDWVYSTALQADGRILLGGRFTGVNGATRNHAARLFNDAATGSLSVPVFNRVQWLRGGAAPETLAATFDLSTTGGASWTSLGAGTRIAGGWELTGLSLPASGQIRARARTLSGHNNGSSGLVQSVAPFTVLTPYQQWKLTELGDANAPDLGDTDGDGLVHLAEYGLRTSPTIPSLPPPVTRFAYAEGERLRIFFTRDPARYDITIEVQVSGDLTGPWTTVATSTLGGVTIGPGYVGGDSAGAGLKTVEVRDIASSSPRFLRFKVTH